ncbi:DUF300-domain-containing protein [Paxillus ammoniavirescens]|nr:DUF300-domain-containing protein [Paxillus ammoniavirescens]
MARTCPSQNTEGVDQTSFWSSGNLNWDEHRIGWAIAGGCTALTVLISLVSVWQHCRNYNKPNEQRQVLRVLYMPPVYAIISFFSYRFFRSYTYYSLAESAYEAVTLSAFLLLLIEYVADTASGHDATKAMERKGKTSLPIPFCCWRYRPTKAYFMYTVKWAVLQYVIVRPACSIAGIICEAFGVLCESGPYSIYFASVYLEAIDFVRRRPLAKFLAIKLIVMFTFYQSFIISALEGHVIQPTQYWTATNIADGLNALAICVEMVFFSSLMMWAYTWNEYKIKDAPKTRIWRPLWDSINYADFAFEIFGSLQFFFTARRRSSGRRLDPETEDNNNTNNSNNYYKSKGFDQAFGIEGSKSKYPRPPKPSSDEEVALAEFSYDNLRHVDSASPISQ